MKDHLTTDELGALLGGRVESIDPIGEPMQIDRAYIEQQIESLKRQRLDAQSVAHQATGAIGAFEAMLARMDQPEDDRSPEPEVQS